MYKENSHLLKILLVPQTLNSLLINFVMRSSSKFLRIIIYLKYLLGHISDGSQFKMVAIIRSPLGHGRCKTFDKVDDASPASLETAANDVPRFFSAAIISALCQSCLSIIPVSFLSLVIQGTMPISTSYYQTNVFMLLQLFPWVRTGCGILKK